jgi:hypothetical protein
MNSDKAKLQQLGQAHRSAQYAGDLAADIGLKPVAPTPARRRRWVLPLLIGSGSGLAAAMVVAVVAGVVVKHAVERRIDEARAAYRAEMTHVALPGVSLAKVPGLSWSNISLTTPDGAVASWSDVPSPGDFPAVIWPTALDVGSVEYNIEDDKENM